MLVANRHWTVVICYSTSTVFLAMASHLSCYRAIAQHTVWSKVHTDRGVNCPSLLLSYARLIGINIVSAIQLSQKDLL